ncbi:thioredoxin domain-containing protein [Halomarina salina]|uniref:Thioredoxin domain-containing protein n=1 Tax=Halomarina salina TaxID=1872699 RepID=A0ABD5RRT8_9EURY|nr:thioredoxin domain-containing protein [Halomarina salina]
MTPTDENRLADAASPYLRQHADNPVNWQPWDDAALESARERDVPIFLSVGYSACHWCHVMADESFSDDETAAVLNEEFVPVKVDREERPDIDQLYLTVCQLVRGNAGWPLSVWLTPDLKPFFVGTYFPPEPRRGMPGFRDLLTDIADSWSTPEDREEMEQRAEQWTRAIEDELEDVPEPDAVPESDLVEDAGAAAVRSADREYGGFGTGQKFPQPGRLHLLARAHDATERDVYREVLDETLDAMASHGLYDHLGGGFHRYCVDREWAVPHFEKMLYDQAELTRAMLEGYRITGTDRYAEAARDTLEFVERELTHPEGGFYSTLDAESVVPEGTANASGGESADGSVVPEDGAPDDAGDADDEGHGEREEGAFYVWTPEQVRAVLADEELADLFCERYGVTQSGNFERGTTVLGVSAPVDELGEEFDRTPEEVERGLTTARERLFEAREERPRPPRDEKVLAGWNGLMTWAFADGALTLGDAFADTAADALDFVRDELWDAETGTLSRRYAADHDGTDVPGYLEDYAFLGRGALATYEATADPDYLGFALDLGRALVERFYDEERGTLYFTPTGGEELVARPQEVTDHATPSSSGVAASLLLALDAFAPNEGFDDVAETTLSANSRRMQSNPLQHSALALAADEFAGGHVELTVAADGWPEGWREQVGETYLPRRLLAPRPAADDALDDWLSTLGVAETPPIWAGREATGGATAYLCESFACSPPQSDLADALAWRDGPVDR